MVYRWWFKVVLPIIFFYVNTKDKINRWIKTFTDFNFLIILGDKKKACKVTTKMEQAYLFLVDKEL